MGIARRHVIRLYYHLCDLLTEVCLIELLAEKYLVYLLEFGKSEFLRHQVERQARALRLGTDALSSALDDLPVVESNFLAGRQQCIDVGKLRLLASETRSQVDLPDRNECNVCDGDYSHTGVSVDLAERIQLLEIDILKTRLFLDAALCRFVNGFGHSHEYARKREFSLKRIFLSSDGYDLQFAVFYREYEKVDCHRGFLESIAAVSLKEFLFCLDLVFLCHVKPLSLIKYPDDRIIVFSCYYVKVIIDP